MKKTLLATALAASMAAAATSHALDLTPLGTFTTGAFDEGASEIVAHDPRSQRLFVINALESVVDVLAIADPANPTEVFKIDVTEDLPDAGGVNSVAVHKGLVAVAVEHDNKQSDGWVAFYDTNGNFLNAVRAGALPDMVAFSPNGRYVLAANEGEPSSDYSIDPEGSVTVIDLRRGVGNPTVATASFPDTVGPDVRITGIPGTTVPQDLEPEYITVSRDSRTAWVTLQENNAIAKIDIRSATVVDVVGLGAKDHSQSGNGIDASNSDGAINIANWPVKGLYMPDAIASYTHRGNTYLVTANEGDAREYDDYGDDGYADVERIRDLDLDPTAFPDFANLQANGNLSRLNAVTTEGFNEGTGKYDELYTFGARSFSIWDAHGNLVYDSGDTMEQKTAALIPDFFNSNNDDNDSFDARSDDKGPEPEGVAIGQVMGRNYAFVGLERVGGIMIFDVTDPVRTSFVNYVNNRNFAVDAEDPAAGDLGPEGIAFIKAGDSPNGMPLLVVGNEVSGTTTLYQVAADSSRQLRHGSADARRYQPRTRHGSAP